MFGTTHICSPNWFFTNRHTIQLSGIQVEGIKDAHLCSPRWPKLPIRTGQNAQAWCRTRCSNWGTDLVAFKHIGKLFDGNPLAQKTDVKKNIQPFVVGSCESLSAVHIDALIVIWKIHCRCMGQKRLWLESANKQFNASWLQHNRSLVLGSLGSANTQLNVSWTQHKWERVVVAVVHHTWLFCLFCFRFVVACCLN
jgi:hypothetical protein